MDKTIKQFTKEAAWVNLIPELMWESKHAVKLVEYISFLEHHLTKLLLLYNQLLLLQ